jgi:TolA-binding protein
MTCPSETELARAMSLDGAIALDAAITATTGHVASCPACARTWNATKHAIDLARRVPVSMPDRDRREEMRTAILAASATKSVLGRGDARDSDARDRARDDDGDACNDDVDAHDTDAHDTDAHDTDAHDTDAHDTDARDDGVEARGDKARDDDVDAHGDKARARRRWYMAGAVLAAAAGIVLVLATRGAPTHSHGTISAHAGARYVVTRAPDEIVTLHDGTIDVDVAPLHAGERFRVVTADTEIEVRGTAFRVVAELGHMTSVVVEHGLVEVRPHGGAMVTLAGGQSWAAPVHTARAPSVVDEHASIEVPGPVDGIATPAAAPRARSPKTAVSTSSPRGSTTPTTAIRTTASAATRAPSTAIRTSAPAPAAPPARALDALAYDEGWSAMRGGDFEHAASAFARVSILEPDGALSEDASYWYAVALARAKRGEAIAAFRDLLSHYPRSTHAGEANAMLGWLLVEAKQPAEAERRFRAAIDDPKASVRDSARSGLATLRR